MKFKKTWKANRPKDFEKINKQREKYPEIVLKLINICDVILEVLDARFIEETRNKELEELIKNKGKRLIFVLNKIDLVDIEKLKIPEDLKPRVFVSCAKRIGSKKLREIIKREVRYRNEKFNRAQVGVIGYPNTGKSSLINFLVGKKTSGTAKEAGFTKGLQKVKLTSKILLIDTPGVIPQKIYSNTEVDKISFHAKVGARNYDKVKNPEFIVQDLLLNYSKEICSYYGLEEEKEAEIFLEKLGRKKNFLISGGNVDIDRTARLVLKDWQEGKIKL